MLMELIANQLKNVDEGPANAIHEEALRSDVTGDTAYSAMTPDEQKVYDEYAFNYFNEQYQSRNMGKYGRLDFENYVGGVTPEEGFITELGQMEATDDTQTTATVWMEIFGQNIEDMKAAAFKVASY